MLDECWWIAWEHRTPEHESQDNAERKLQICLQNSASSLAPAAVQKREVRIGTIFLGSTPKGSESHPAHPSFKEKGK